MAKGKKQKPVGFRESYVRIGRVLHEDDDFITLEVAKDLNKILEVRDDDQFLSLTFVRELNGLAVKWLPWKKREKE